MTNTRRPTSHIAPFGLRMQDDLRERLEAAAADSGRSLNAEIVARLMTSFDADGFTPAQRLMFDKVMAEIEQLRRDLNGGRG